MSLAQVIPPKPTSLKLTPSQQERMADYIRECEVEKDITLYRFEQLMRANQRISELENESPEISRTHLVVMTLLALASGFVVGNNLK